MGKGNAKLGCILAVIGGLGFLVTIIAFIGVIFTSVFGIADDYQRIVMPGEKTITIDEPGIHTIFYEYKSEVDGVVYAGGKDLPGLELQVTDPVSGSDLLLDSGASGNYEAGKYAGYALYKVDFPSAGDYIVRGEFVGDGSGAPSVIAIGSGFAGKLMGTVFGGVSIMLFGMTCSMVLLAIGVVLFIMAKTSTRTP